MRFFTRDFHRPQITVYPLGDFHLGSRQFREDFVKQVVDEIASNDDAVWVGVGDMMENALIGSKSDVYTQDRPPTEQAEAVIELLDPIKKKGLFLIAGNHEQRTMRTAGFIPEQHIATRLGLPYKGFSCFAVINLTDCHGPHGFTMYFHHNYGGGYTRGGKVNRAHALRAIAPTVDATFSAHLHTTDRDPVTWYEPVREGIVTRLGYDYITGCALDYDESYAEERAKTPATLEFIKVTFVGGTNGHFDSRKQIYEVIIPENKDDEKN